MLFNLVFEGNLADEPELKYLPSGKAMCKLRVAHNVRRFDSATSKWVDGSPMWVTVTAWEKLAERIGESRLQRGDTVIVEARDDLSVWAYTKRDTQEPAGQLQVTAANLSVSMRFNPAQSQRPERAATAAASDAWASAERELEPAF